MSAGGIREPSAGEQPEFLRGDLGDGVGEGGLMFEEG
jgi:hypothetical protein